MWIWCLWHMKTYASYETIKFWKKSPIFVLQMGFCSTINWFAIYYIQLLESKLFSFKNRDWCRSKLKNFMNQVPRIPYLSKSFLCYTEWLHPHRGLQRIWLSTFWRMKSQFWKRIWCFQGFSSGIKLELAKQTTSKQPSLLEYKSTGIIWAYSFKPMLEG